MQFGGKGWYSKLG